MQSKKPTVPSPFDRQEYMDYLRVKYNVPSNIRKMHKGKEVIRWVYENNPDVEIEYSSDRGDVFTFLSSETAFQAQGFYRIKTTPVVYRQVIYVCNNQDFHRISYDKYTTEKEFTDEHLGRVEYKFIGWYEPTAKYREE